jgi:hypothetical protein
MTDFLNLIDGEWQFYQLQAQLVAARLASGAHFLFDKEPGRRPAKLPVVPPSSVPQRAMVAAFRLVLSRATPPTADSLCSKKDTFLFVVDSPCDICGGMSEYQ